MSEIIGTINENAAQARAQQLRDEEAAAVALAEWKEKEERRRIRRRKRATVAVVLRGVLVLVVGSILMGAESAGWIDSRLSAPMVTALVSWLAVWVGGWAQFMYADGGLFKWH